MALLRSNASFDLPPSSKAVIYDTARVITKGSNQIISDQSGPTPFLCGTAALLSSTLIAHPNPLHRRAALVPYVARARPPPAVSPPRCDRKQLQAWSQPPAQRRLHLISPRPRIGEIKQGRDAIHVRHAQHSDDGLAALGARGGGADVIGENVVALVE